MGRPNIKIVDNTIMSARPVQISLDSDLLARVDRDPQTKKQGRSAFIRDAIELYLAARRRREIDVRIATAYRGERDDLLEEAIAWSEEQAWPEK
jgi:metal-responsive CopG/Arc/MetJ family transcriptional regulator